MRVRKIRGFTIASVMAVLLSSVTLPTASAALTVEWQRRAGIELGSVAPYGAVSIVTGSIDLPDTRHPGLLVRRYDTSGNVMWSRTWHPRGTRVRGLDVAVAPDARNRDESFYVVGEIARANLEGGGFFLRKYSARGRFLWKRISEGGYGRGVGIPEIATGVAVHGRRVIVVGFEYGCCGQTLEAGWVKAFRVNGRLLWERNFEVPGIPSATNDVPLDVATDRTGAYIVGRVETAPRPDESVTVDSELVVQKISFSGDRRWTWVLRDQGVKDDDEGTGVDVRHGRVFVVGDVDGRTFRRGRGFVARLTTGGDVLWRRPWGDPSDRIEPAAVSAPGKGPIAIAGSQGDADDRSTDVFVRRVELDGSFVEEAVIDRARDVAGTGVAAYFGAVHVSGWIETDDGDTVGRLWRFDV